MCPVSGDPVGVVESDSDSDSSSDGEKQLIDIKRENKKLSKFLATEEEEAYESNGPLRTKNEILDADVDEVIDIKYVELNDMIPVGEVLIEPTI